MNKNKTKMTVPLGIASVWFATHAGPGAAAGKFSAIYFNAYGKWGLFTPAVSMALIGWCVYVGLEYSRIKGINNFKDFVQSFFHPYGEMFSILFDLTYLAGVLIALAAGIAAAAGVLTNYTGIPLWLTASFVVIVSTLLSIFGSEVVRSSNTIMTLIILFSLGSIIITGLSSPLSNFATNWSATNFADHSFIKAMVSAAVYAGVLTAGCLANTIAVSDDLQTHKQSRQAAIFGFIANNLMVIPIALTLFAFPQFIMDDFPNYSIAEALGVKGLLLAYVVMVFLAVVSTNVSYAYSTAIRFGAKLPIKNITVRNLVSTLLLFLISYIISFLGLSVIISKGYTYLGYLAIITVILPIIILGNRKIKKAKLEQVEVIGEEI